MKRILMGIGIVALAAIAGSCTKHEYCMCSYSKVPGDSPVVYQEFHIEDKSCSTYIPEDWLLDPVTYLNPRCEKISD